MKAVTLILLATTPYHQVIASDKVEHLLLDSIAPIDEITQVDFSDERYSMSLSRYYGSLNPVNSSQTMMAWRHSYEHRLYRIDNHLVVIKPDGTATFFNQNDDLIKSNRRTVFRSANTSDGVISTLANNSTWTTQDRTISFLGKYPVRIVKSGMPIQTIYYKNGIIDKILNDIGEAFVFSYHENRTYVTTPNNDSIVWHYDSRRRLSRVEAKDHWSFSYTNTDTAQCEVLDTGKMDKCKDGKTMDDLFSFYNIVPGSEQLDIRPSSCLSYFDDSNVFSRGSNIEAAYASEVAPSHAVVTPHNFPTIDYITSGTATLSTSIDLTAQIYSLSDNSLADEIVQFASRHLRFDKTLSENGSISSLGNGSLITVERSDVTDYEIQIIIQHGMATLDQVTQIENARESLMANWGISLVVVEIP